MILQTKLLVDHRNGDGLDNRRRNLREATNSQNTANRLRQRPGASGVVGVRKRKNRYQATINIGRRRVFIGSFVTLEEAAAARQRAMTERYGEFAPVRTLGERAPVAKSRGFEPDPRPIVTRNNLRKARI
jgi:hypothetical protein